MQESISTLLHTLLYTYNSWILLCPSNCPSAPGCKGRALSAPAMTLSQIPHPSSAPESLITPRAEAQLPHLILRGCYLQEIRFLHWMAFLIQSRRVCCLLKCPPFPDKPVALPVSAALETPLLPISALAIAGVCQDALQSLCKPELCCPSQPCTLPLRPGNFGSFGNWTSSLSTNTPSTWEPWSRETPQSHPLHLQGEHGSQLESLKQCCTCCSWSTPDVSPGKPKHPDCSERQMKLSVCPETSAHTSSPSNVFHKK